MWMCRPDQSRPNGSFNCDWRSAKLDAGHRGISLETARTQARHHRVRLDRARAPERSRDALVSPRARSVGRLLVAAQTTASRSLDLGRAHTVRAPGRAPLSAPRRNAAAPPAD